MGPRLAKIPYPNMPPGTSPVRQGQCRLPSPFDFVPAAPAPITSLSAAPVGASRVAQARSAHLSGCPQRPPGFAAGFQTLTTLGAYSPQNLLLPMRPCMQRNYACVPVWSCRVSPTPLCTINGSHQAARPYRLGCLSLPLYAFSHVDRHLAASRFCPLIAPSRETSWENTPACKHS